MPVLQTVLDLVTYRMTFSQALLDKGAYNPCGSLTKALHLHSYQTRKTFMPLKINRS